MNTRANSGQARIVALMESQQKLFTTQEIKALPEFGNVKDIPTTLANLVVFGRLKRAARGLYCGLNFPEDKLAEAVAEKLAATGGITGTGGLLSRVRQVVAARTAATEASTGSEIEAPSDAVKIEATTAAEAHDQHIEVSVPSCNWCGGCVECIKVSVDFHAQK